MSYNYYNPYGSYGGGVVPPQYRLQQYQPGELAYDARLASHEQQANGANEPYGPQGNIFLQTLFNGQNNGQGNTFLNTPQRVQWFQNALGKSFDPNSGQLDGRFLRQAVADSYYAGTGVDILPQLNQSPLYPANTDPRVVYQQFADPSRPGGYDMLKRQSGWNDQQITADAEWGHAQFELGRLTNQNVRPFLYDAFTNPQNFQDYPLVHTNPQTGGYVLGLLGNPRPADQLNQDFLNLQAQSFGNPYVANPQGFSGGYYPQQQQPYGYPPRW